MKIGLEIHQRLDTNKLFCNCPSRLEEGTPADIRIERMLHPVLSELGKIDRAALAESEKGKRFEYWAYPSSNCLVETDEEPPHAMNPEALAIALQIALQLQARPVEEIHCMRKIVIDGSNTSGFQRTAVVAMGGLLKTERGTVGITQIALEEESAGIVETREDRTVYRLDRLGIPLVEVSTEPEIVDAAHCREVAEKIGLLLRATGRVARGIGTIRQDLNVSIEDGARVEIKGAQELKLLSLFVGNEVRRQKELLVLAEELRHRVYGKEFIGGQVDLTDVFASTQAKLIANGIQRGERVWGMRIDRHAGMLGKEINPNRRYATELSEYAKTAGVKGIIHSDEDLQKYGISGTEVQGVKQKLQTAESDAFILVVAVPGIAQQALQKVGARLKMFAVPEETRRANPDGTSSYMRPLPGSARMYPETDVPPIELTPQFLKQVRQQKGESLEEKQSKLRGLLNEEMAGKMLKSPKLGLFEKLVGEGIEPMLAAGTLENTLVALRREGVEPNDRQVIEALHGCREGKWVKAAIPEILKLETTGRKVEGRGWKLEDAATEKDLLRISGKALEKLAEEQGYDFGKIMQRYRLQVDAQELQELLKRRRGDATP